jgi:hypothetical protein
VLRQALVPALVPAPLKPQRVVLAVPVRASAAVASRPGARSGRCTGRPGAALGEDGAHGMTSRRTPQAPPPRGRARPTRRPAPTCERAATATPSRNPSQSSPPARSRHLSRARAQQTERCRPPARAPRIRHPWRCLPRGECARHRQPSSSLRTPTRHHRHTAAQTPLREAVTSRPNQRSRSKRYDEPRKCTPHLRRERETGLHTNTCSTSTRELLQSGAKRPPAPADGR